MECEFNSAACNLLYTKLFREREIVLDLIQWCMSTSAVLAALDMARTMDDGIQVSARDVIDAVGGLDPTIAVTLTLVVSTAQVLVLSSPSSLSHPHDALR